MKYIVSILGIISIIVVTVVNFYPNEVMDVIDKYVLKKEYVIAKANDYYVENNDKYFKNYTDDVSNKEELINYIYYVVNTGSNYADGECTKEYTECINDLDMILKDEDTLSLINNFVHPYNSFSEIGFVYDNRGKFSLEIKHIYSDEDITKLNYIVDNKIDTLINDNMNLRDKVKVLHDDLIDTTDYDVLKTKNIDDDTYRSKTAYGVLIQGYGICSGYADTMAIYLNKLGIDNYKISNDSHIWNLVYLNGVWTHIDATWDDPVSIFNENRDTYFLIDTKQLESLDDKTHTFDKSIYKEAV